jgi:hypothetical protein
LPRLQKLTHKEIRQAGREFDDNYLQPIKDMLPDVPEPIAEVGRFIDDEFLQPTKDYLLEGGETKGGALFAQPSAHTYYGRFV